MDKKDTPNEDTITKQTPRKHLIFMACLGLSLLFNVVAAVVILTGDDETASTTLSQDVDSQEDVSEKQITLEAEAGESSEELQEQAEEPVYEQNKTTEPTQSVPLERKMTYYEYLSTLMNKKLTYDQGDPQFVHSITVSKIVRDVYINDILDSSKLAFYIEIENNSTENHNYSIEDFTVEDLKGEIFSVERAKDSEGQAWTDSDLSPGGSKDVVLIYDEAGEGFLIWNPLGLDESNPVKMLYTEY